MDETVKVAACQMVEVREDVGKVVSGMEMFAERAEAEGASLVCFPECFLQGYLTDAAGARRCAMDLDSAAFGEVLRRLSGVGPMLVFGMIEMEGGALFNTAVVALGGRLVGRYRKVHLLPGERIFTAGVGYPVFEIEGLRFGINICFDTQFAEAAAAVAGQGGRLIVCPSNNMMRREKAIGWKDVHNQTRCARAKEAGVWVVSADVTGEMGDRVGLGPTAIVDPTGRVVRQVPAGEVGMVVMGVG